MIDGREIVAVIAIAVLFFVLGLAFSPSHDPKPLAERIEAACGTTASPIDFTSGGELGGTSVGDVVLVTCEAHKPNKFGQYRTFKRVVQR